MSSKMMNCRFQRPGASCRLICFPWAGGGSNFYANWGKIISEDVEVVGVTLPGREVRFKDPCTDSLESISEEIVSTIHNRFNDMPFAFWGHSLGALLSFKVTCMIKEQYGDQPQKMFLSGVSGPHSPARKKRTTVVSELTNSQFIEYLRKLGGTPVEILDNKDMMEMFLPVLRADYSLLDQLIYELPAGDPPLTCPISFFDGEEDQEHDIESWKELTSGSFSVTKFPGGHFYLKDPANMHKLVEIINREFSGLNEIV